MYEKVVAIVSLALFAGFLAIVGFWVESTSLRVLLVVAVVLAAYDFWRTRDIGNGGERN